MKLGFREDCITHTLRSHKAIRIIGFSSSYFSHLFVINLEVLVWSLSQDLRLNHTWIGSMSINRRIQAWMFRNAQGCLRGCQSALLSVSGSPATEALVDFCRSGRLFGTQRLHVLGWLQSSIRNYTLARIVVTFIMLQVWISILNMPGIITLWSTCEAKALPLSCWFSQEQLEAL